MLCTRMWSRGITHSLPKFAASFKASTSYTRQAKVSLTGRKPDAVVKYINILVDTGRFYSPIQLSDRMQQHERRAAALMGFFVFTLPDFSLWILVSHTFFTNRRLFIWFLMTLMSKGQRNKDNTGGEESKV